MTLTLKVDSGGTRYVKIDADNIDRIQGETGGRQTVVCYRGVTWDKDGGMRYVNTNITVFEPVEDVIKKFEATGQKMKSFQCYTDDKKTRTSYKRGAFLMTNNTIYLKSGDAFILIREDSVEIVQKDGNSCIAKRIEESKSLVEFFKRTPEELAEISENYEKSRPTVNNMIPQFKQPLNAMTPKREEDITTVCNVPKFHGPNGDELAEAVALELGQKVIRITEEL